MNTRFFIALVCALAVFTVAANAASQTPYEGPRRAADIDGSRTPAVHLIPLLDEAWEEIRSDDDPAQPFSTRMTCGDCHDYSTIGMGWHFNASAGNSRAGRPGEPWFLIDKDTGTQVPLSYRPWPGTWTPEQLGLTPWDFVKTFGRHMPGGDVGEKVEDPPDMNARWDISGHLEINCLVCHNASPDQNQSEWVFQVGRENFRWAATGASGLGVVRNMASKLPDWFDPVFGPNPDDLWNMPPKVDYDKAKFDPDQRVFFDVVRDPPPERCYFCHSTTPADTNMAKSWQNDGDVHMTTGGFTCTDCHRNGLDHFITRGYEGESSHPQTASLTCAGCHLGEGCEGSPEAEGGRLGAPVPTHDGLPESHLEEMTCTACHAGPLPTQDVGRVKTSRANRLGIHGAAQWDTELPYILAPVFLKQADGTIAPQNIMWPAYWGVMKEQEVTPLPVEAVAPFVTVLRQTKAFEALKAEWQKAETDTAEVELDYDTEDAKVKAQEGLEKAGKANAIAVEETTAESAANLLAANTAFQVAVADFKRFLAAQLEAEEEEEEEEEAEAEPKEAEQTEQEPEPDTDGWLTRVEVAAVLKELARQAGLDGEPVYVAGGKLHRRSGADAMLAVDHAAAAPYSWLLGHDVRPVSQSLGIGGCTDCHAPDAPFFFAQVEPDSPSQVGEIAAGAPMYEMQGYDLNLLKAWEQGAKLRNLYLIGGVALAGLLAVALIHYGFLGLEGILRAFVPSARRKSIGGPRPLS